MKSDKIKEVLEGLHGVIKKENVELYKKLIDKDSSGYDIESPEDFYLFLTYPHKKFLEGLIQSEISSNSEVAFLLIHSDYVENHFVKIIKDLEGFACSADKSRTIMNRLLAWFKDGTRIEFNYDAEYTYHLPKTVFTTHDEIIEFYEGVKRLYFGNNKEYLMAIKNIYSKIKKEPTKEEIESNLQDTLSKMKKDPQYELKVEFGKLLTRNIDSLTADERKRYDELQSILTSKPDASNDKA